MKCTKTTIGSLDDLKKIHQEDKLVLIQLSAAWCGPCRKISSYIEENVDGDKVIWVYVDTDDDDMQEVVDEVYPDLRSLPTFVWYYEGEKLCFHTGANQDNFNSIYEKLTTEN